MKLITKDIIEKEGKIYLSNQADKANILRISGIIVFILGVIFCLLGSGGVFLGGIFIVLSIIVIITSLDNFRIITIIDSHNKTVSLGKAKYNFSDVCCINSFSYFMDTKTSFKHRHTIDIVINSTGSSNNNPVKVIQEYAQILQRAEQNPLTDEEFDATLDKVGYKFEDSCENSLPVINTGSELSAWNIAEKIAKLINVPIIDISSAESGSILFRQPNQFNLPFHKYLQADIFPTTNIQSSGFSTIKHKVINDKLSIEWKIDNEDCIVEIDKQNMIVGHSKTISLNNIQCIRCRTDGLYPMISIINDNDILKLSGDDIDTTKEIYHRIIHFLANELNKQ